LQPRPPRQFCFPTTRRTIAPARRIPEVLALVGLSLRKPKDEPLAEIPKNELKAQLEQNIEHLAEAEHDGWMEHRSRNGWSWAETRDDPRKLHPICCLM
jgi:hypothetical protein